MARIGLLLFLAARSLGGQEAASTDTTRAAREFLAILRPALRAECIYPIQDEDRLEWSYLPGRRKGLPLKRMNGEERRAAHAMLRTALSAHGYEKAEGVIELEGILREIEHADIRDPDLYTLAVFGDPAVERPWGWRFEGHHLSLNFSSVTGKIVASTPAFFGANPARVPKGARAGWRVLAAEEDLARRLLASLDRRQRAAAIIAASAPADIILSPGRKRVPDPAGLPYAEMSKEQQQILMWLVDEYLGNMRDDVARAQRQKIESRGLPAIRFAWAGGTEPGEGHYYRIQGPTFVIEYDNTQDHANHVHSVFRDLEGDFGGDLLRSHYAESLHHRHGGRRHADSPSGASSAAATRPGIDSVW